MDYAKMKAQIPRVMKALEDAHEKFGRKPLRSTQISQCLGYTIDGLIGGKLQTIFACLEHEVGEGRVRKTTQLQSGISLYELIPEEERCQDQE